ncbi:MAG: hypothetical protein WA654_02090, partial [Candidatus Sulfotelmatobacter sp.]
MAASIQLQTNQPESEKYSVAIVTAKGTSFHEIGKYLSPTFHTVLASTEEQIQAAVHDPGTHGIVFDLDCISEGAADGIEVLQEIRKLREDVVLVAITESS